MSHKERGKSLRDKLAHKRFVQAFVINFTSSGFRLFGGGESLGTQGPSDSRGLTEVLRERLGPLHRGVADMLDAFQRAVSDHESSVGTKTDNP